MARFKFYLHAQRLDLEVPNLWHSTVWEWPESLRKEWRHSRQESGDSDRWREGLWLGKTWRLRKGLQQNERPLKSSSFWNHRWYDRKVL